MPHRCTASDAEAGTAPLPPPDLLEQRLALSTAALGPYLSVDSTSPSDGARLGGPPTTVSITFDRPVDPNSIDFVDVGLDRVGDDGSLTPIFDPSAGVDEEFDDSGTVMTVSIDSPLAPGNYRLILAGSSSLIGLDGSTLDGDGSDRDLADFSVVNPGVNLAGATDLGVLPPGGLVSVPGSLDLASDPQAVGLYKVRVPDGQFWRLGLEVDARRIGSPLDAAVTLFDANGQPIAADDNGRPDFPTDPYLFQGVGPGTYYVGVSASGNLPGTPGGYDPSAGVAGSNATDDPGGPFTLDLAADPDDAPPLVLGFHLDSADPHDPSPTGLTLQFSAPLRMDGSQLGSGNDGIQVVDSTGKVWPAAAVSYDESTARLSFVFLDRLPAGDYSVRLRPGPGLADLAGLAPVSPGLPTGVLATFATNDDAPPADPDDLGVPRPNELVAGVSRTTDLAPEAQTSYRFVALVDGFDRLEAQATSSPVQVDLLDATTGELQPVGVVPARRRPALPADGLGGPRLLAPVHLARGRRLVRLVEAVGPAPGGRLAPEQRGRAGAGAQPPPRLAGRLRRLGRLDLADLDLDAGRPFRLDDRPAAVAGLVVDFADGHVHDGRPDLLAGRPPGRGPVVLEHRGPPERPGRPLPRGRRLAGRPPVELLGLRPRLVDLLAGRGAGHPRLRRVGRLAHPRLVRPGRRPDSAPLGRAGPDRRCPRLHRRGRPRPPGREPRGPDPLAAGRTRPARLRPAGAPPGEPRRGRPLGRAGRGRRADRPGRGRARPDRPRTRPRPGPGRGPTESEEAGLPAPLAAALLAAAVVGTRTTFRRRLSQGREALRALVRGLDLSGRP